MREENGQLQDVDIIPDFENEMIEDMPQPTKKKGCGCQKNEMAETPETNTKWIRISLIVGTLLLAYFLYKNSKGNVSVPKVEVPEVN